MATCSLRSLASRTVAAMDEQDQPHQTQDQYQDRHQEQERAVSPNNDDDAFEISQHGPLWIERANAKRFGSAFTTHLSRFVSADLDGVHSTPDWKSNVSGTIELEPE